MNRDELKKIIPHREPMLLVDEAYAEDGTAYGSYTVRGDEWFLQGHFPDNPVVPGVILCEIMAQTCCVLLAGKADGATPYFTGLNAVKFRSPVKPLDKIEIKCTINKEKPPFYFAAGSVSTGSKLCASGEFSFALVSDNKTDEV